nr:uncharacterized protein LOC129051782 [Pongo abelii]XP_054394924.1 uncharacterized protein LOC129051782 [Pongo abelii]XP_054394925.1 uncharacterized protein LOC129051782 [Pongo abelii]
MPRHPRPLTPEPSRAGAERESAGRGRHNITQDASQPRARTRGRSPASPAGTPRVREAPGGDTQPTTTDQHATHLDTVGKKGQDIQTGPQGHEQHPSPTREAQAEGRTHHHSSPRERGPRASARRGRHTPGGETHGGTAQLRQGGWGWALAAGRTTRHRPGQRRQGPGTAGRQEEGKLRRTTHRAARGSQREARRSRGGSPLTRQSRRRKLRVTGTTCIQLVGQVTPTDGGQGETQRDTSRQEAEADIEARGVGSVPQYSPGAQSRRRARQTRTTVKRLRHSGRRVAPQPHPLSPCCHFSVPPIPDPSPLARTQTHRFGHI